MYENECKNECVEKGLHCRAQHESGYGCTRVEGHTGKHVACGLQNGHDYKIWEGSNEKRN